MCSELGTTITHASTLVKASATKFETPVNLHFPFWQYLTVTESFSLFFDKLTTRIACSFSLCIFVDLRKRWLKSRVPKSQRTRKYFYVEPWRPEKLTSIHYKFVFFSLHYQQVFGFLKKNKIKYTRHEILPCVHCIK